MTLRLARGVVIPTTSSVLIWERRRGQDEAKTCKNVQLHPLSWFVWGSTPNVRNPERRPNSPWRTGVSLCIVKSVCYEAEVEKVCSTAMKAKVRFDVQHSSPKEAMHERPNVDLSGKVLSLGRALKIVCGATWSDSAQAL